MIALILRHLYPAADPLRDYTVADDGTGPRITAWHLPTPQPTPAELAAALPAAQAAAQARADLTEAQAMLDERYRLYTRAVASGNTQDAADIQAEIQDILTYIQEVRNAAGAA
ncbi:hypothetical protein Dcar01_02407 [Deinococcus carri]|uniref:Bacteriophage SP-beta YorD domain-containing protein n=1 Tax=Deinococcus carri TaxID=1211323 RepID=A0ABP9WAU4_9DEIO